MGASKNRVSFNTEAGAKVTHVTFLTLYKDGTCRNTQIKRFAYKAFKTTLQRLYFSSYFFLHVQVTLRLRYLKFTHASLQVPSQEKKKKKFLRPKIVWLLRLGKKKKWEIYE